MKKEYTKVASRATDAGQKLPPVQEAVGILTDIVEIVHEQVPDLESSRGDHRQYEQGRDRQWSF